MFRLKTYILTLGLAVLLLVLSVCSLFVGVLDINFTSIWQGDLYQWEILLISRLPRLSAILCTGVGMSVAGLIMQQLCMNKYGRCSIIGKEIGFQNVGVNTDIDTSSHGNEASFEFVLSQNPDYIFALDRDAAIGTQGAQLAAEVLDNELVSKTDAAQNGNVVVLEHSNVWYTAEGGITALGAMLSDLEDALMK